MCVGGWEREAAAHAWFLLISADIKPVSVLDMDIQIADHSDQVNNLTSDTLVSCTSKFPNELQIKSLAV